MARIITYRDSRVNTYRVRPASQTVNNGEMIAFAAQLKRYRLAAGFTQEQLAHACGYKGQSRIANYESGTRTPRLDELPRLADALGIEVSELLGLSTALTPDKQTMLDLWETLDADGRKAVKTVGHAFAKPPVDKAGGQD